MELTVYNPQKGRLETVNGLLTRDNTTWFDDCLDAFDIYSITDFEGGLLISAFRHSYPIWVYGTSRADIGYARSKAFELRQRYE
jgi:hypothetical protein